MSIHNITWHGTIDIVFIYYILSIISSNIVTLIFKIGAINILLIYLKSESRLTKKLVLFMSMKVL